jgi:hypothetical protein
MLNTCLTLKTKSPPDNPVRVRIPPKKFLIFPVDISCR